MNPKIFEWSSLIDSQQENSLSIDKFEEVLKSFTEYKKEVKESKKVIGNFEKRNIYVRDNDLYNHGNNVGILETNENNILELVPKFDSRLNNRTSYFWRFLPHMLGTISGYNDISEKLFLDTNKKIRLPDGVNIVSLLTLSFVSICFRVLERGLVKRYELKNERLKAVKGRINYAEMSRKNAWDFSNVPCIYNDLTFDNKENRIILWCANRLLKEIKKIETGNKTLYVGKKLREIFILLNEEITLEPQSILSFRTINLSGISHHYVDIMKICQAILTEKLFSFDKDKNKSNFGINFIIDMDWVFESYMTFLFEEVAKEINSVDIFTGKKISVEAQSKGSLCDEGNISIRPDLIVKVNNEIKAIIDFKWKLHENKNNADFYQIICYSLAKVEESKFEKINAALVSISENDYNSGVFEKPFDTITKELKNNSRIDIYKIPVASSLLEGEAEEIEKNIKEKIVLKYFESIIN